MPGIGNIEKFIMAQWKQASWAMIWLGQDPITADQHDFRLSYVLNRILLKIAFVNLKLISGIFIFIFLFFIFYFFTFGCWGDWNYWYGKVVENMFFIAILGTQINTWICFIFQKICFHQSSKQGQSKFLLFLSWSYECLFEFDVPKKPIFEAIK